MIFEKILPKSIIDKIYEYDSTYHDIYTIVKKEFILKTPFWRVKWLNKTFDISDSRDNDIPLYYYESYKYQILHIIEYWNTYKFPSNNPLGFVRVGSNEKINNNCTSEYITDENGKGGVCKILRHINSLKGYFPTNDYKLYKPGKKSNICICRE